MADEVNVDASANADAKVDEKQDEKKFGSKLRDEVGKIGDRAKSFEHEAEARIRNTKDMDHGEKSEAAKKREEDEKAVRENPELALPAQSRDVDHDALPPVTVEGRTGTSVSGISPQLNAENETGVSGTLPGV